MSAAAAGVDVGETVAVIGLGLVGGSIARDLAARGIRVVACDREATSVQSALAAGVVQGEFDMNEAPDADVVVIATPVDEAHGVLRLIAGLGCRARLVFDVGSTKSAIVETASAHGLDEVFVGAHPLAGDHLSGWHSSRVGLFQGARVFLCPTRRSRPESVAAAMRFWSFLGGSPECVDAKAHDDWIAWSSHLPHVVSSALALVLRRAGIRRQALGPGGRGMTRLAGSSPAVWAPIARENATAVSNALQAMEDELRALRLLLLTREDEPDGAGERLVSRLGEAQQWSQISNWTGP